MKRMIKAAFHAVGLDLVRLPKPVVAREPKYFNTGALSPLEENSRELYDRFYGDQEEVDFYYNSQKCANVSRLDFYRAVSALAKEHHVELDGRVVIDVGCGTGHMLSALQEWSLPSRLFGCDFSGAAVSLSRERFPSIEFFQHDIYGPLPERYDVVFCTEVLEHLEKPHVALAQLLRAINPGGAIILTVPNGRFDQLNEHINFWSPESWRAFLLRECAPRAVTTAALFEGAYNVAIVRN